MEEASAPGDRGFTLIELVLAVGLIAMMTAVGIGITLSSRSLVVTSAATEFDQFLDSARTMARDLGGVTLAFAPDAYGDGTVVRLLAHDASGALVPTTLPPLQARAIIEETQSLGKPPFGFDLHVNGALGGRPGFQVGNDTAAEVGCPVSGAFHFLVHTANASVERFVPCRVALANAGPVALQSWPPEPPQPTATPCSGVGCTIPTLPTPPSSSPVCPPNFSPVPGGCVPAATPSPNPGAQYHVSVTGAPTSLAVGSNGAFTAQAALTNAGSVAPGTPATIPVFVAQTTAGVCAVTPSGSQPSGSTFTITALLGGTCTITMQGDPSAVIGATADTATLTITISVAPTPNPTPTPQACDLTQNGKCYHLIVGPTSALFEKDVYPNTVCNPDNSCAFLPSVKQITLTTGYVVTAPIPPQSPEQALLFRVDKIESVAYSCLPYSAIASLPGNDPLPIFVSGVGSPVNAATGFGDPGTFVPRSYFLPDAIPSAIYDDTSSSSLIKATLDSWVLTMSLQQIGTVSMLTFYAPNATSSTGWFPDFPGCDNSGDLGFPGVEFGEVTVQIGFEVYQMSADQ